MDSTDFSTPCFILSLWLIIKSFISWTLLEIPLSLFHSHCSLWYFTVNLSFSKQNSWIGGCLIKEAELNVSRRLACVNAFIVRSLERFGVLSGFCFLISKTHIPTHSAHTKATPTINNSVSLGNHRCACRFDTWQGISVLYSNCLCFCYIIRLSEICSGNT